MEPNETLLTQEFAKKLKDKLQKINGGKRLPRRKYVPRNPNLHTNLHNLKFVRHDVYQQQHFRVSNELEEGELPPLTTEQVQNPLNTLMEKFSDPPAPQCHSPVPIKTESNSPPVIKEEEITVTPDLNLLATPDDDRDTTTTFDNQISLKKVRALTFPCPLCPMEATQGHIRFHLHSVHGPLLRSADALHTCLICNQLVKSKDILPHSLSHDFDTAHECNYCEDKFFYKIRLDQHLERVHQTFSCEFCEMTFYSRKEWKCHTTSKAHKIKKFAHEELNKRGINLI